MDKSKTILITGGGGGTGLVLSEYFNNQNYSVIAVDKKFQKNNLSIKTFKCDFSNLNNLDDLMKKIKKFRINYIINNAGISVQSNKPYSYQVLKKTFNINFFFHYLLTDFLVKQAIKKKIENFSLINISSLGEKFGFSNNPSYQTSKAALSQFTRSLAKDYSIYGFRFNNIMPGYIKTNMTIRSFKNKSKSKERIDRVPLNRWGNSKDLIKICEFLLSNNSSYINGATIPVDGGWSISGI